ncbi:MAG: VCBS repeat-containing protein [Planctomycetota bacterium]
MNALLVAALLAAAPPQGDELVVERRQTLRLPGPVAAWRALDLDGDGPVELLTVDRAGRVVVRRAGEDGIYPVEVAGGIRLGEPARSLLALLPDPARGVLDLLVVDPGGTKLHRLVDGAGFDPEPVMLAERGVFELRTGRPLFADLVQDVNGDGRADLVLPEGRGVGLWMESEGQDGARTFRRAATVPVRIRHRQGAEVEALSSTIYETLSIPRLSTEDVNGDGRADLVVLEAARRAFHLQRADGSYALTPDATLDLSIFRDTTPEAKLAPGRTLVLGDDASVQSSDLDGDGIPDYVVAHRRKVWVFHGSEEGPQFVEPSSIFKTAEDITGLVLLDLDDDAFVDLLIYKVVVPSIGALLVGMFQSWDVEITAHGYRNLEGERFGTKPKHEGLVVLRLPPLLEVLRRPEDVLEKIEQAERTFRTASTGDFDGDGLRDVALIGEEGSLLEVWRTPSAEHLEAAEESDDAWVRRLIFEQEDPVFGLDRVLSYLSAFGERRTASLTGDRGSDARLDLGEGSGLPLVAAIPADVDGDGADELVTAYAALDGRLVVEILAVTRRP